MPVPSSKKAKTDLQLSQFTIEHLPEAIFWINAEGKIIQTNRAATVISGYTKEELLDMAVFNFNPAMTKEKWIQHWQKTKQHKSLTFKSTHRHKSGYNYDVEITNNFIQIDRQEYSCSVVRDIRKRKLEEELLRTVSEATSGVTGEDFLLELAKHITFTLTMRYALITECANAGKTKLRTLCYVDGNKVLDNIEYGTAGIPCEIIMQGKDFFMGKDVQKTFPKEKGIEAAIGVPIYSSVSREILGHILVIDPNPVTDEKNQTAILRIFAARAGAEMERMKAEKSLEKTNIQLKERLNEIELYHTTMQNLRDQIFWLNKEGKIIKVNDAVTQLSGYSFSELMNMSVFDLNPALTKEEWQKRWQETREQGQQLIETFHHNKKGYNYEVEVTNNFIEYDGEEYFCSSVRDIRKRKMEEQLLRIIAEKTASITGEKYLLELAKYVSAALGVRYSMVCKYSNAEKTKLKMVSYVDREKVLDGFEYDPIGTPCEVVMKGNDFFCSENLEDIYPREKGIRSWVAVPIYSPTTGEAIGNIGAFDKVSMNKEQNQTDILRIFAARAGAEMERIEAQQDLEKANEELAKRLKEIEQLKNQLAAENKYLQEEIKLTYNFDEIVSKSKSFHKILQQIEQVASTEATVLILGESGTGKELLARAVHNISNRCKKPLVKVNCAALPANLIESELFGHERGAFTGALERKIGRFELANGGTVFLDEIGELPFELQSKLLRIIQEGEFERLGNPVTHKVNVRIIAATNRNLEQAIEKKEFREDLYYRLNVFPINCPPLRDRKEDIPLLVKHFCQKYEAKIGKRITSIPSKVMNALCDYNWPGNIRELENIIERALILSRGNTLEYGDWLPKEKYTTNKIAKQNLQDVERDHIIEVLKKTGWKVSGERGAAKILGLNATTLEARMKKLEIKREV